MIEVKTKSSLDFAAVPLAKVSGSYVVDVNDKSSAFGMVELNEFHALLTPTEVTDNNGLTTGRKISMKGFQHGCEVQLPLQE